MDSWWNGTVSGMEAMGLHERIILLGGMARLVEWKQWGGMNALFY